MSAICGVCNSTCDEKSEIRCSACEVVFHLKCLKADAEGVKTRANKEWKCRDCRSVSNSAKSATGTSALTKDFLRKVIEEFKTDLFSELKSFRKDLEEVKSSMQVVSDALDKSNEMMKEIQKSYLEMKKENKELKETTFVLSRTVGELQDKVRTLEQYTRKNNIEISGIPVTPRESVNEIVKDLGKVLGVEVDDSQINLAHRIPSFKKERIPSIVVQFHARSTKEEWVSKYQKRKQRSSLLASDVNVAYSRNRVFVSEHLSPDNKIFLSKLKEKCKDVGFKFAWCRDGRFYARKKEGENCVKINTLLDIDNLK
ncbi:E3 ubiquitin-protein ligase TRAIP-like [Homalodisca vitripennis]|uniref:E3 ubiquitin-protein ligase TRAIP-like n=1 Tax=Homalodisca vitripennis TaxID=197043 RepID=UPI001EEC416E|nr:E3 ubiquitin-protein ligase TRAIP-like [Homalodisca vitripennis]